MIHQTRSVFLAIFTFAFINQVLGIDCRQPQSDERNCMICNCAHEAGNYVSLPSGRTDQGAITDLMLVHNSVITRFLKFYVIQPANLCQVIYDSKQYSWTNEKQPRREVPDHGKVYEACNEAYEEATSEENITRIKEDDEAPNHYHADYVDPVWAKDCKRLEKIGVHIQYYCKSKRVHAANLAKLAQRGTMNFQSAIFTPDGGVVRQSLRGGR